MKNKKFVFPKQVLSNINECSNGGFILFTLNDEGLPEVHSDFDNPIHAMALQYYVNNWSKAVEMLNTEATTSSLEIQELPPQSGEIEESEDNDEDYI